MTLTSIPRIVRRLPLCTATILVTLVAVTAIPWPARPANQSFTDRRNQIISEEEKLKIGGVPSQSQQLTDDEKKVDQYIKKEKEIMIEASRTEGLSFAPAINFMTSRLDMESTNLFRLIQKMPKGGALHLHKTAIASLDWVVRNVTYRPNLYMCVGSDSFVSFQFSDTAPVDPACTWSLVSSQRKNLNASQTVEFDRSLRDNLTLVSRQPDEDYPDLSAVWERFEKFFNVIGPLLSYRPVFKDYMQEVFRQFLADGVQYLEIRGSLPKLYELNGTEYPREFSLDDAYRPAIRDFKRTNPSFIGAKLIITTFRGKSPSSIGRFINETAKVYQANSDLVVGADLVGQEDVNHPLLDFKDALLAPSRMDPPIHLPYYFHAGETVWQETETDWNLVDAILLNTSRIGHGYALHKHPLLMKRVKQKNIAIEVNPISNQVLKLVEDLRNHPAAVLIAKDFPVVISSDDPMVWDALPLSHDFYVTLLALTGKDSGLATLKQLARNSIQYSAMNETEKAEALQKWQTQWKSFIQTEAAKLTQAG